MFSDFGDCYRIYRACELVKKESDTGEWQLLGLLFWYFTQWLMNQNTFVLSLAILDTPEWVGNPSLHKTRGGFMFQTLWTALAKWQNHINYIFIAKLTNSLERTYHAFYFFQKSQDVEICTIHRFCQPGSWAGYLSRYVPISQPKP